MIASGSKPRSLQPLGSVAIALRLYGMPFEHRPWSTFGDADRIRPYNPLTRVPTLVLDDANSTAVLINGAIGTGVSEVEIDRRTLTSDKGNGATRLEASHNGYEARYGLTHRRILILRDDGTELRGEDLLLPKGKGKRGKVGFAIRFHLGAGIDVALSDDRQGAGLALGDGSYWQFRSGSGEITLEDSIWAEEQGRPVATHQLVIQGLVSRGGGNFAWLLKKMG